MTDERQQDDTVSAEYRELAREKTPAHLDARVLGMARKHAKRPSYAGSIRWTRPLAWAATITLCLAITLEIARTPPARVEADARSPVVEADTVTLPEAEVEAAAAPARARRSVEQAEDRSVDQARPASLPSESQSLQKKEAKERPNTAEEIVVSGARLADAPLPASAASNFEVRDEEMLQRADDMADARSGNEEPLPEKLSFNAGVAADRDTNSDSLCPEAERGSPETWLKCIDGLRETADAGAIRQEIDRLTAVFPDFQLP